jgi:hypothetical protein
MAGKFAAICTCRQWADGIGLTPTQCHTSMYDMATTTTREFIRNFSRLKKAAANGEEVVVRDRKGKLYSFQARGPGPSLGEQLSDLCRNRT